MKKIAILALISCFFLTFPVLANNGGNGLNKCERITLHLNQKRRLLKSLSFHTPTRKTHGIISKTRSDIAKLEQLEEEIGRLEDLSAKCK